MKKTVIISCPTLKRELEAALEKSGSRAEVIYLPGRLHNSPPLLKERLQELIDEQREVQRIVLGPSGCGGATCGLQATTAELVVPRVRDCLDILLSSRGQGGCRIERPKHGVFYTDSWMKHTMESEIDLARVEQRLGQEKAHAFLRKLYKGFEHFYIIDTGVYEVEKVRSYLEPLRQVLSGQLEVLPGQYGILWKIAQGNFDEDFWRIPQGSAMPADAYRPDYDL